MVERWLPVPGYEGVYEVSDQGRVRSIDRVAGNGRRYRSRILKGSPASYGHLQVSLARDGIVSRRYIHHLVAEVFLGPRPEGLNCLHDDGDPNNNSAGNLYWGTQSQNMLDRVRHGTHPQLNKMSCPRKHPLTEGNLVPSSLRKGRRDCLTCNRERSRARYQSIRNKK